MMNSNHYPDLRLLIYQPKLFAYRADVFDNLRLHLDLYVVDGDDYISPRLRIKNTFSFLRFSLEHKFLYHVLFGRSFTHVFMPTNVNSLSFHILPLICFLKGQKLFFHGQGDFKNKLKSPIYRLLFRPSVSFCYRYISYCDIKKNVHLFYGKLPPITIYNRFEAIDCNYTPDFTNNPFSVCFIGRPRNGSGISGLLEISAKLAAEIDQFHLHFIGATSADLSFCDNHSFVTFHGDVRSDARLHKIAAMCSIGLYYGDCGLSVLHYMSLGLCPVIHSSFAKHSGPEPEYLIHNVNGVLFRRNSIDSCLSALLTLFNNQEHLSLLRKRAFATALRLHSKPFSTELLDVLKY